MLTLPLEPTDDRADPIFKDAASCTAWLAQLQLTNLQLAHSRLLIQINELNRLPMRGTVRLETLEVLRETVGYVQEDLAKKFTGKPLPLSEGELTIFVSVIQLWQAMVTGYQRGLQACISGEKQMIRHGALLCQRCLHYSGLIIFEHIRTGYQPAVKRWHQLHELYAFAEQQQFELTEVADPLSAQPTHCAGTYIKSLLACYANPAQLTHRQLQQMDLWLTSWSSTLSLSGRYAPSKNDAPPLAIDLPGAQGLQRVEGLRHHEQMRYLAIVPLSKLLRVKTILLEQSPQQPGDERTASLELLHLLYSRWCENRRSCIRRPCSMNTTLRYNPHQPHTHDALFKLKDESAKKTQPVHHWRIINENIMGALLFYTDMEEARMVAKQLIALRQGNSHMLGTTAWTGIMQDGVLAMGIKYFPGQPEPVQIRASGAAPTTAYLLPALPAITTPASLIMPRNWFKPKKSIEILHENGQVSGVRLGFSVEHGLDYERASFTPLSPEP